MAKHKQKRNKRLRWIIHPLAIIAYISLLLSYLSPFIHPQSIWWVSLFGLGYPIVFWCNLLLLTLLFVFYKNTFRWIVLGSLIIGLPLHTRHFALGNEKKAKPNKTAISIMSYNVRLFDKYKWIGDELFHPKDSIIELIKTNQPAILCLQEYLVDNSDKPHIRIEELLSANNYAHYYQRTVQEQGKLQFGLATFSTYPIVFKGNVFKGEAQDQFCIYTDIKVDDQIIRVYNMHLQSISFQKEDYQAFLSNEGGDLGRIKHFKHMVQKIKKAYVPRAQQAKKILEHIRQSPYPVIACGDFNDTPLSFVYNLFNNELQDVFRKVGFGTGRTYAGKIPAGRIDYIFSSDEFVPLSFLIHTKVFSDHFAISARIELLNTQDN
jgi:endonuclease/exonuclease/phosphatase family metal-dependent hydrolase